jgi:hypothetical protein
MTKLSLEYARNYEKITTKRQKNKRKARWGAAARGENDT